MEFDKAIETLNKAQKECVFSESTSLQILAGPGSGKTRVLTMRVAHLILEKNIAPNRIIVVTFTNKAANEMRERLVKLIGEQKTMKLLIGTFHAICSRLLHRYAAYAGLDPNFTICDPEESKTIISKIQEDKTVNMSDFTRKQMEAGAILGIISKAKSQGEDQYTFQNYYGDLFKRKDIATIYFKYEEELKRQNLVDFDNLLLKTCVLLRRKQDVLANIKSILVDEYQDTNVVQYDLIKLMRNQINNKTVTIVGDPDQSIFGWRSAEPKNFGKMAEEFPETTSMNMERNYRSTGLIIEAALHVITQDDSRIDKDLYTNNPKGVPMSLITTHDSQSEADFVATEIKNVIENSKGLIQYKDIAVLMRMNFISRQFESTFRLHKIPFTMVGGDRFFDRIEVKDMTSYLAFAYNPKNATAFKRIINVPKRGIGEITLNKILKVNEEDGDSMLNSLENIIKQKTFITFNPKLFAKLRHFIDVCNHIRYLIDKKKPVENILTYIYEATEYKKHLKDKHFNDWESRWENLGELLSIAKNAHKETLARGDQFSDDDDFDYTDENSTFVEPIVPESTNIQSEQAESADAHPVKDEPMDEHSLKEEPIDIQLEQAEVKKEEEDELDLTSLKEEIKIEPVIESSLKNHSTEDKNFNPKEFGLKDNSQKQKKQKSSTSDLDPVAEFLEYCSLCSNQKELEEAEGGKVTIATLHASKGLEWPCVFIVTCNNGVIPHAKAEDDHEEGRLLYVGMTRSQFLLYCTSPKFREEWGDRRSQTISPFLTEMAPEICSDTPIKWTPEVRTLLATTINRPIPDESEKTTEAKNIDIRFGVGGSRTDLETMGGFAPASTLRTDKDKKPTKRSKPKQKPSNTQKKLKMIEEGN